MKTLILDNYDSFTYNLFQYLAEIGGNPVVKKNDEVDLDWVKEFGPSHIVISPGPGHPGVEADFGLCGAVISELYSQIPILGVCLGCQGIGSKFGAKVVHAPEVFHGRRDKILVEGDSVLFKGLPSEIEGMRYHSLVIDEDGLDPALRVTARSADLGLIMGIEHENGLLHGIQFHPESIGTPEGMRILQNFLEV